jgi:spore maturation protein CgeB
LKLVKLSTAYPIYLERIYRSKPGLAGKIYSQQQAEIFADAFGTYDSWTSALKSLGYEVTEILANARPLQRAWAGENDVSSGGSNWFYHVAASQIKQARPDILLLTDYNNFPGPWIENLRTLVPSIKLVIVWCGAPFSGHSVFTASDLVLTCIPELRERFRKLGFCSEHIDHAFNPSVLERLDADTDSGPDFTFVGQINRQNDFHYDREKLLLQLLKNTPLKIFSPSSELGLRDEFMASLRIGAYDLVRLARGAKIPDSFLAGIPGISSAARWTGRPRMPVNRDLKEHLLPPVFGLEMYQLLADSKITLNSHIDISPRSASNMRLFEATGVGTCLLTDWKENLGDLFEPDVEVVTYRSASECAEKVHYLLRHPEEREAIACAGRKRTLSDHTINQRMVELDGLIRQRIGLKGG